MRSAASGALYAVNGRLHNADQRISPSTWEIHSHREYAEGELHKKATQHPLPPLPPTTTYTLIILCIRVYLSS